MSSRRAVALAILLAGAALLLLQLKRARQTSDSSGASSFSLSGKAVQDQVPGPARHSRMSTPEASAEESAPDALTAATRMKAPLPAATQTVAETSESASLPAATILENMRTTVRQYASAFGENPVGTNPEITSALQGANPKHINFLKSDGNRVNAQGELVDAWGTPYFFHQISGHEMEIRSAGPDRVMYTADDLVIK